MLKYLFMLLLMGVVSSEWVILQSLLFLGSFLFGVMSMSIFFMGDMGFGLGVDYISYILILLSFWIVSLMVSSSQVIFKKNNFFKEFLFVNVALLLSLVLTFCCTDYLMFYLCFESSLVPTLILILGWGYQPERIQAGVYMLFYTLLASLPLLGSLMIVYSSKGSLTLGLVGEVTCSDLSLKIWYFCSVFAFVVKMPMFMVHLWLPKAHVEAPVGGSMILAGVLLKLGGYGLIRVCEMFYTVGLSYSWIWVGLGLGGGVLSSIICLCQVDMKSLIAYSSVSHMGMVLGGVMIYNWWGLSGAMTVMVGHGLCSCGLFCLANMVYERLGSRSLLISKGLLSFMPSMGFWWFLLVTSNMSAPPSLNLLGELSLICSLISWSSACMLASGLLVFFSAVCSLYMYSLSQHGKNFNSFYSCCSGKVREYLVLSLHWVPLNVMIVSSSLKLMFI